MKNYKIISILALAALMTACNVNKGNSKSPAKLASLGKEIEFSEIEELVKDPDFLRPWADLGHNHFPSSVISGSYYATLDSKLTSKKKVVAKTDNYQKMSILAKTDMKNLRLYMKEDMAMEMSTVNAGGENKQSMKGVYESTTQFWKTKEDGVDKMYYIDADQTNRSARFRQDVSDSSTYDRMDMIESEATEMFDDFGLLPSEFFFVAENYPILQPEAKESYKFYKNKEIYTIVYTVESTYHEALDADTVKSLTKEKEVETYQLDLSKGSSYSYKTVETVETETKYLANFVDNDGTAIFIDDVLKSKSSTNLSFEVKAQDVNVKEVDISGFTKYYL